MNEDADRARMDESRERVAHMMRKATRLAAYMKARPEYGQSSADLPVYQTLMEMGTDHLNARRYIAAVRALDIFGELFSDDNADLTSDEISFLAEFMV